MKHFLCKLHHISHISDDSMWEYVLVKVSPKLFGFCAEKHGFRLKFGAYTSTTYPDEGTVGTFAIRSSECLDEESYICMGSSNQNKFLSLIIPVISIMLKNQNLLTEMRKFYD